MTRGGALAVDRLTLLAIPAPDPHPFHDRPGASDAAEAVLRPCRRHTAVSRDDLVRDGRP